jgi:hypothetical protein
MQQVTPAQVPKHKPRIGFWGLIKRDYRDKGRAHEAVFLLLVLGVLGFIAGATAALTWLIANYPVSVISCAGSAVVLFIVLALSSWYAHLKEKYNV